MTIIRYPRHFACLAVAALALINVVPLSVPSWLDRFTFFSALDGLLHAGAVVLALNVAASWIKRLTFAAITAVLSGGVPYFGLAFERPLGLDGTAAFLAAFAIGSAGGAAAYWLLVRVFWIRSLTAASLMRTIAFCVGATLVSFAMAVLVSGFGRTPSVVGDVLPTVCWWLAFSYSLYLSERAGMTANNALERERGR
jgi:hypothetical protein